MAKRTGKKAQQQIDMSGSGAVATGGSVAAGAGAVAVGGNVGGSITITTNVLPAERAVDSLHQLPAPPADFTGREKELAELTRKIQQGVTISGVQGMGGTGKTALALKLAESLAPLYPDAQFFLDLKGAAEQQPLTPAEAMRHVIQSIEPNSKLPDDPQQLAGLYHSLLHRKRALLLWDNARDAEQVRPLLAGGCLALVTSREHFSLPGMERYDLGTLGEQDACDLIRKIAEQVSLDEAGQIAKLCDYLPLAVRVSAGALAEQADLGVSELVEGLKGSLALLGPVEASLRLSYDLLSYDLKGRFCQLAVFPAPFEREAAAAVWELEPKAAREALSELLKRSLLDYDKPGDRYDLHDLVRLFAACRLGRDEPLAKAALARHADHYLVVARACDDEYLKGGEHILPALAWFREIWPQLEAAWNRMDRGWGEQTLRPEGAERWLADFPNALPHALNLLLTPRQQVAILERAARASRELGDRNAEGYAVRRMGPAYSALGEGRRALELQERYLEIARELGDRKVQGDALGSIGFAYLLLGEDDRAIEFHERALEIAREIGDRGAEGYALGNLGGAYVMHGEPRRAIEYYEQALVIYRETGDRWEEAHLLGSLGSAYAALGEERQALEFEEERVVIAREIGDRKGEGIALASVGNALDRLGWAYADPGETRRAIEFYEQALAIAREIGDREAAAMALRAMAAALYGLGEKQRGIALMREALQIFIEIESPNAEWARGQLEAWRVS